jgi:uncharacterized membrane protein
MRIEHSIDIEAPAQRVWELTLDVERWPELTPSVTSVERLDEGRLALGSQARIKQPAQSAKVWTVTELRPPQRFAWTTRWMGMRMTGTHDLADDEGTTVNTLGVELEGALAPILGRLLRLPIGRALAQENEGFKLAAEGTSLAGRDGGTRGRSRRPVA